MRERHRVAAIQKTARWGVGRGGRALGIRECRTRARRCESRSEVPGGFSGVRKRRYGAARTRPKTSSRGRSHAPEARAAFVAMYRCVRVAVGKYESLPSKVQQCATRVLLVRSDGIRGDTRVCVPGTTPVRRATTHRKFQTQLARAQLCLLLLLGAALAPSSPLVAPLLGISLRTFARGRAAMSGFGRGATGAVPARSTATPLNPLGLAGRARLLQHRRGRGRARGGGGSAREVRRARRGVLFASARNRARRDPPRAAVRAPDRALRTTPVDDSSTDRDASRDDDDAGPPSSPAREEARARRR